MQQSALGSAEEMAPAHAELGLEAASRKRTMQPKGAGPERPKRPRNLMGLLGVGGISEGSSMAHSLQPWQAPGALHRMFIKMKTTRKQVSAHCFVLSRAFDGGFLEPSDAFLCPLKWRARTCRVGAGDQSMPAMPAGETKVRSWASLHFVHRSTHPRGLLRCFGCAAPPHLPPPSSSCYTPM